MKRSPAANSPTVDRQIEAAQWYVRHESEQGISASDWREWQEWGSKPGSAVQYAEFKRLHRLLASLPRPDLPRTEDVFTDLPRGAPRPFWMNGGGGFKPRLAQSRMAAMCCAGLVLLGLLGGWLLGQYQMRSTLAASTSRVDTGSAFSDSALERMRAEGRPVFVNLRASWCPTCTVNERTVLARNPVQQMLARKGVAYLTGDWSLQDPMISAQLRRFGRNGVPLYLLFSPGSKEPTIFPQVLTEHAVLRELARLPDPKASSS